MFKKVLNGFLDDDKVELEFSPSMKMDIEYITDFTFEKKVPEYTAAE